MNGLNSISTDSSCREKCRCQQTPSWAPGAQVGAALAEAAISLCALCGLRKTLPCRWQEGGPRHRRQLGPHFRLLFSLAKGPANVTGSRSQVRRLRLVPGAQQSAGVSTHFCSTRCVFLVHLGGLDWGCSLEQRWHFGPSRKWTTRQARFTRIVGDLLW